MELTVLSTGSAGNAYLLRADNGATLLLDAGVSVRRICQASDGLRGVQGCLLTHEHNDHARAIPDLAAKGVDIYAGALTFGKLPSSAVTQWRFRSLPEEVPQSVGDFTVVPFKTQHDAVQPYGYLIRENGSGETALYATDTYYLHNTFPEINYWIVECNYIEEIALRQYESGRISREQMTRLKTSHMTLRRLKDVFRANDLRKTYAIVLVHLSDGNSDESQIIREIEELTGIRTVAADNGQVIRLSRSPF